MHKISVIFSWIVIKYSIFTILPGVLRQNMLNGIFGSLFWPVLYCFLRYICVIFVFSKDPNANYDKANPKYRYYKDSYEHILFNYFNNGLMVIKLQFAFFLFNLFQYLLF
jgi:hypothetical protein